MRWARNGLLAIAALPIGSCQTQPVGPVGLQGWTWGQQDAWYVADQGSRLIPQAWIDALEQPIGAPPVGSGKFVDASYLAQFNYTPASAFARKDAAVTSSAVACPIDQALPIGFVTDCQDSSKFGVTNLAWRSAQPSTEAWVGMNCSACHTNTIELHYADGKPAPTETLLVDGAPTLADFQHFMAALEKSLKQTYRDDGRFTRFAAAVLPAGETTASAPKLKLAMASLIAWNEKLAALNADEGTHYGYARLDAIGHIFNKVALAALPDGTQTSNPSDAPVSYPFLWNVPELNKVEWNGIADNTPLHLIGTNDPGALGRNTGEVTGVFADLTLTPNANEHGFVSSARVDILTDIEDQLRLLHAPSWPARLGLDQTLVSRGQTLFATNCAACHKTTPDSTNSSGAHYVVNLTPLAESGTDIWMACNAAFDQAKAGALIGDQEDIILGNRITDPALNLMMVQTAVVGTILNQKDRTIVVTLADLFGLNKGLPQPPLTGFAEIPAKQLRENACTAAMHDKTSNHYSQLVYKGRPLQGIWATAPFLHNGSVPSLHALLLPPDKRPKQFCVGSHVLDPAEVGFEHQLPCPPNTQEFDVLDTTGNPIPGNSNAGHDYNNAGFTEDDRNALVEYMKTL